MNSSSPHRYALNAWFKPQKLHMGFLDWFNQGYLDAGDNFFSLSDNEPTLIHRLAQRTTTNKGANQFRLPRVIWDKLSPDVQAEIKEWNKTKVIHSRPKAHSRVANIHDIMGYSEEVDVSTGDDSMSTWQMMW